MLMQERSGHTTASQCLRTGRAIEMADPIQIYSVLCAFFFLTKQNDSTKQWIWKERAVELFCFVQAFRRNVQSWFARDHRVKSKKNQAQSFETWLSPFPIYQRCRIFIWRLSTGNKHRPPFCRGENVRTVPWFREPHISAPNFQIFMAIAMSEGLQSMRCSVIWMKKVRPRSLKKSSQAHCGANTRMSLGSFTRLSTCILQPVQNTMCAFGVTFRFDVFKALRWNKKDLQNPNISC